MQYETKYTQGFITVNLGTNIGWKLIKSLIINFA